MAMINGGELVVRSLRNAGVDTIFGLHGAHIDAVFQACMDNDEITIIDNRHEAASGHAAEGFARATRKLGVALVTAGGGFTNVVTPLANALKDRTPLLVLTGSGPLDKDESNDLQAQIDQVAIAKPITKWAHRVTKTDQIPRMIAQAIRIATSAPRGPVLLDIPWDVLMMTPVEEDEIGLIEAPVSNSGASLSRQDAETTLDVLAKAKRPVIIVGSEARWANNDKALAALAANTGAPVFSDFEGLGMLSKLPEEFRGGLIQGLYGFAKAGAAPDAVLLLGMRFGLSSLHGSGKFIPHTAQIVQIDPDARELGRLQSITLGVQAEVGASMSLLAEMSASNTTDRAEWRKQAKEIIAQRYDGTSADSDTDLPLHPFVASQVIEKHVDNTTTVIADGALTYMWLGEVISKANPKNYICHGYLGSMGVGFGVAVGAAYALRENQKPSILVIGDGAVGYNLSEFDTLARKNIPLIVVIMNNRSWGATQHFQEIVGGPDRVTNTPLPNGDYYKAAEALGADGYLATTSEEFDEALSKAIKAKRPACIDVRIRVAASPPEEKIMMGGEPF